MEDHSYTRIQAEDAAEHQDCPLKWDCVNCTKNLCIQLVAIADFPSMFGHFRILGFTNNKDGKDHTIIVKGDVSGKENVLCRVHSSCLTGDALGSMRCDCGPQLRRSMVMMEEEGIGILVYMQQEGRGIGLTNKLRAYMRQDDGLDTYDANLALGFPADERDYEITAAMLKRLDFGDIRLITNNPSKVDALRKYGVKIRDVVPIQTGLNEYNERYFEAKRDRFGHHLDLSGKQVRDPCGCNQ
jgi:3,4-dihydroxy 2-butanone 4-phosphate synthase / GTP cyclohydrolase II